MCEIIEMNNYELLPGGTEKESILNLIKNQNMTKCKVSISVGSQKGDNYIGIIHVITVEGQDTNSGKHKSMTFILKTASRLETFRELFKADIMFGREIFLYTSVLPTFHQLQTACKMNDIFECYPKIYDTSVQHFNEFLIMENMKSKGFIMKDRKQPLDFNHCKLALKELGKFHACSFALKKFQPDVDKYYSEKLVHFMRNSKDMESFKQHNEKMASRALQSLDPIKDIKEKQVFEAFIDRINDLFSLVIEGQCTDRYSVIIHGDCWSNNILYKYSDTNNPDTPTEVCLLDWQISFYASPAVDLSNFIYNCMSPESLENNFDQAIQTYYDSLSNALKEMNCDPEELFPFSELQNQIQKYFNIGLTISFTLIQLFTSEKDEIPNFDEMKDLSPEELSKWDFKSKNIDIYNTRMSAVVKHAVKMGYI